MKRAEGNFKPERYTAKHARAKSQIKITLGDKVIMTKG